MNLFDLFFKNLKKKGVLFIALSPFFIEIDQFFQETMIYKTVLFKTSFKRSSAEIKISM